MGGSSEAWSGFGRAWMAGPAGWGGAPPIRPDGWLRALGGDWGLPWMPAETKERRWRDNGNPWGGPGGPGSRPRAAKGDVRQAILALLSEGPRHGYQVIGEITERSLGQWRPSPGSVYPALAALQDEGLVDDEKIDGKRVFSLTEAGSAYVAARADELSAVFASFAETTEHADVTDLKALIAGVAGAAVQVAAMGSPTQAERARSILAQARRDLYAVLADDDTEE